MTPKVMDGLMDLEVTHRWGKPLLSEFFPGQLRPEEEAWWNGNTATYDDLRTKERSSRGPPRSKFPNYKLHCVQSIRNMPAPSAEVEKNIHYRDSIKHVKASGEKDLVKADSKDLSIPSYPGRQEEMAKTTPTKDDQKDSENSSGRSSPQYSLAPSSSTQAEKRDIDRTTDFASFLNGLDSEPATIEKDGKSESSREPYWV